MSQLAESDRFNADGLRRSIDDLSNVAVRRCASSRLKTLSCKQGLSVDRDRVSVAALVQKIHRASDLALAFQFSDGAFSPGQAFHLCLVHSRLGVENEAIPDGLDVWNLRFPSRTLRLDRKSVV